MFRYNKTTQCAVAALSKLAETYDEGKTVLSSGVIAQSRNLPKPLVAKLLTVLGQAGYVAGTPGPGGGYTLSRPPSDISLFEITEIFERSEESGICPFGPSWCRNQQPCPLHEQLMRVHDSMLTFLKTTSLEVFCQDRK